MQSFLKCFGLDNNASPRPQSSEIYDGVPAKHMESNTPDWYNTLDIDSSLLDQFDDDNIIELRLRDQINENPLLYWHNMSNIELNLFDQFNDDSIIEHESKDQRSKHLWQWQLASDNDLKPSGFDKIVEVIKASLGFWPKPWQIKDLFNIKQGRDTVIMAGIRSGKSLLFQAPPLIMRNAILLVIMPILALMED